MGESLFPMRPRCEPRAFRRDRAVLGRARTGRVDDGRVDDRHVDDGRALFTTCNWRF